MSKPAECSICEREATIMCGKAGCLKMFCDTCPRCPIGSCDNDEHRTMCWDSHLPPSWAPKRDLHQQCSIEDHNFVREILQCEADPERQNTLHQEDRKAIWFIAEPGKEITTGDNQDGTVRRTGTLYVTGRLNNILAEKTLPDEHRRLRFPALVSFIGETGAGKSTLIRALIKESSNKVERTDGQKPEFETPVVQTSSPDNLTHPTSSGVHLYKDPRTAALSHPMLFADCEGFNAGGISAASFPKDLATDKNILAKFPMTASSYTTSTNIEDLYAMSLYTFSDCVCFVIRNGQTAAKSMERLLLWAVKGSGTAIHTLPQKSLILILNAPPSQHTEHFMDEKKLRDIFLDEHLTFWNDNPVLSNICRSAFRNTPVTAEKLVHLYFSTVNVLYIPDGSRTGVRPEDIRRQLRKLHTQITNDIKHIGNIRQRTFTQFNEKDFTRLFYRSVQHFATTDNVFNFFEATKSSSLDPRGLEDHILAMRRQFAATTGANRQARFPAIVASALVNKVIREDIDNFNTKLQWSKCHAACEKAIDRFHKQFKTCEFREYGKRCIQTFDLHGPSHKDKNNKIIRNGGFHPQLEELDNLITAELAEIEAQFHTQYVEIFQGDRTNQQYPAPARVVEHRRNILSHKYDRACPLFSYRTCFACLHAIPDHVLPCGHAFCETCIKDFGRPIDEQAGAFQIDRCIFDGTAWSGGKEQIIQTKPGFAGIRILTLDGGGARGILELAMLDLLSDMIGLNLPMSHFFDLIVGTGTGGVIAVGVGVEQVRLVTMQNKLIGLLSGTFTAIRGKNTWGTGLSWVAGMVGQFGPAALAGAGFMLLAGWGVNLLYKKSIYKTEPLRNGTQKLLGAETSMFGSSIRLQRQRSTRVAVMCMKDAVQVSAIANYNRPLTGSLTANDSSQYVPGITTAAFDDFERAENEEDELKAWEASVATFAPYPYLRPFVKQSSETTYTDGGLEHYSHIDWATEEYKRIWDRPGSEAKLDVLVSLGSGTFTETEADDLTAPSSSLFSPVTALIAGNVHDPNWKQNWSCFRRRRSQFSAISHRLDVVIDGIQTKPDDHESVGNLILAFNKAVVHQDENLLLDEAPTTIIQPLRDEMNIVAHILVAKLFFFEPTSPLRLVKDTLNSSRDLYQLSGKILCRLQQGSTVLQKLVKRIAAFSAVESEHESDLHQFSTLGTRERISTIDMTGVKGAVRSGGRFEINHTIITSNRESSFQAICVELRHAAIIPRLNINNDGEYSKKTTLDYLSEKLAISGFPCRISDLTRRSQPMDPQDRIQCGVLE